MRVNEIEGWDKGTKIRSHYWLPICYIYYDDVCVCWFDEENKEVEMET